MTTTHAAAAKIDIENLTDLVRDYEADGMWHKAHATRERLNTLIAEHPEIAAELDREATEAREAAQKARAARCAAGFVARGLD